MYVPFVTTSLSEQIKVSLSLSLSLSLHLCLSDRSSSGDMYGDLVDGVDSQE
jgi:hypothetical protein